MSGPLTSLQCLPTVITEFNLTAIGSHAIVNNYHPAGSLLFAPASPHPCENIEWQIHLLAPSS